MSRSVDVEIAYIYILNCHNTLEVVIDDKDVEEIPIPSCDVIIELIGGIA